MASAYAQAQKYLESLPSIQGYMRKKYHPSFYLERMRLLLNELHHPEMGFRYVHITGTSGKGSVTMFLHNMLKASGKKVGSYVSPHTTTVVERTLINGKTISVNDFVWGVNKIKPAVQRMMERGSKFAPSYFEALFAVSLLVFHKQRVQWVVLEVGCGGEFDATNTIPTPEAAVVTNVHLDHQQLLGRTRAAIAATKSGIIKPKTLVFTGEQDPKIRAIIQKRARITDSTFFYIQKPKIPFQLIEQKMTWNDPLVGSVTTHLLGEHQQHNASIAIAVARKLRIPQSAIQKGLSFTTLPCRSEYVQTKPIVLLDGAHNPAKMKALASLFRKLHYKKVIALVGIGHNKPIKQLLRILKPVADEFIFTKASVEQPEPEDPKTIQRMLKEISHKPSSAVAQPFQALDLALKKTENNDVLLITGSLYLTGELRTHWISEKKILQTQRSKP